MGDGAHAFIMTGFSRGSVSRSCRTTEIPRRLRVVLLVVAVVLLRSNSLSPSLCFTSLASSGIRAGARADKDSFAGFTSCLGHREVCVQQCGISPSKKYGDVKRWVSLFGEEEGGVFATPEYLLKDMGKDYTQHGAPVPPWLTLERWNALPSYQKNRNLVWYNKFFDDNGIPIIDLKAEYTLDRALDLLLLMNSRVPSEKDHCVNIHMNMNLDARFPDQQIRTSLVLPHGTGQEVRVAVFCDEGDAEEVKNAGACQWGDALAKNIADGVLDFDVLLTKPAMMPKLARLGRILGPKKLMPSPKSGTVITNYEKGVQTFKGGTIAIRTDKVSGIHTPIGRLRFGKQKLKENIQSVMQQLVEKRPEGAKEHYWKNMFVHVTWTPTVKLSPEEFPIVPKPKISALSR